MDLAGPCQEAGRNLLTGDSLVNMIGCWLLAAGCPAPSPARSRARRPTWRVAMGIYPVTAIEPGAVAFTGGEHSLGFGRVRLAHNAESGASAGCAAQACNFAQIVQFGRPGWQADDSMRNESASFSGILIGRVGRNEAVIATPGSH